MDRSWPGARWGEREAEGRGGCGGTPRESPPRRAPKAAGLEILPSPCRTPRTPQVTRRRGRRSGARATARRAEGLGLAAGCGTPGGEEALGPAASPPAAPAAAGDEPRTGASLEFLCSWQLHGAPPPPRFRYLPASLPPAGGAAACGGGAWAVRGLANPAIPPPYTPEGLLRALAEGQEKLPLAVLERGPQRVVRAGVQTGLEVFWLGAATGWGVRTLESLEPGQFVCEYTGEILSDSEAEQRCMSPPGRDAYLFNLTTLAQCRLLAGTSAPERAFEEEEEEEEPEFVLDAFESGSVGRFLNHACGPSPLANVTPVFVFAEGPAGGLPDARLPRVALFANRRVAAGEELRYDYDMQPGEVSSLDGGGRSLACHCGSGACRGWVY